MNVRRAFSKNPSLTFLVAVSFLVLPLRGLAGEASRPDPAATRLYAVAVKLQSVRLYAQAAQKWQELIRQFPQDLRVANARHHLGICQLHGKQFADAAVTFQVLIEEHPQFASLDSAQFNLGLSLYNIALASKKPEDHRAAAEAFSQVRAKSEKSEHVPMALFYQGECLYSAGELPGAVTVYQELLSAYPKHELMPQVIYSLGTTLYELGKAKESADTLQAFLKQYPKHELAGECQLRLGLSLLGQKDYAEAEKVFHKAASVEGFEHADFALAHYAQCLYEREQHSQAAAAYASLPKRFPSSKYCGHALLAGGKCWYQAGKLSEARDLLTQIKPDLPEAPEAAYWLGWTLIKLKKPAEAVGVLEKAISAYPQSSFLPQLVFARANAIYEQPGRSQESAKLFADFAAKHTDHELSPKAIYMASLAALESKEYSQARQHAEAFLANEKLAKHELVPEVLFIAGEACTLADPPDPANAEAHYQRLVKGFAEHKQCATAQVRIGLCKYLAGEYSEAVQYLSRIVVGLKEPPLTAEAHFLIGRSHSDAGKPADAVNAFHAAWKAKPDWNRGDEVLLALALALRSQGKASEAAAELERLNGSFPESSYRDQGYYQLGDIAYEQDKLDEAIAHFIRVNADFPNSRWAAPAQLSLGLALLAEKEFEQSIEALTKLLDTHSQSSACARARYVRGLAYQRSGKHDAGLKDLTAYLASEPEPQDIPEARLALALCQMELKKPAEAAQTLAKLLREAPGYAAADQAHYEMGFALMAAHKENEAVEAFAQLAAKFPNSPLAAEADFRVGEFHERAERWPEAANAYQAGLQKAKAAPLREKLQYKLGWVQFQREDFAAAREVLKKQLEEHSQGELNVDARYLAGECLFREGKCQEALPEFAKVIETKAPKYHARSLYRSGACSANLQQWPQSQQYYQELIEHFPDFELVNEARYGLGWALQNQEKLQEAKEAYQQVTEATNSETAAKSRFMIGECDFREKSYQRAIEHFLEAAVGYPYPEWQALGYFEAGRCFIELKDVPRALDMLETVVNKYPKHPRAKSAADLIADLKKGTTG